MNEWRSSDPRNDLINRKWASIVILRPHPNGQGWDAGTGHVEMKHGWHVATSFAEKPMVTDDWDAAWCWTLAPERTR